MSIEDMVGHTLADGDAVNFPPTQVVVNDADSGVQSFVLTQGAPMIDGIEDLQTGVGSEIFRDDTFHAPNTNVTYTLPSLQDGLYFAESFDAAGNNSTSRLYVQQNSIVAYDQNDSQLPLQASLPIAPSFAWWQTASPTFSLVNGNGIASFKILHNSIPGLQIVFSTVIVPAQTSAQISPDPTTLSDSPMEYIARLTDALGNITDRYFVIDTRPPFVDLTQVTIDAVAGTAQINATVSDEGSGMGRTDLTIQGASIDPPNYTGPSSPPGPPSMPFSQTVSAGNYFVHGRDITNKTGAPGGPGSVNFSATDDAFATGNAGHVLKTVNVNVASFRINQSYQFMDLQTAYEAGDLTFQNGAPADVGKVEIHAQSAEGAPNSDFQIVSYPPTSDQIILTTDGHLGLFNSTPNLNLAPVVTLSANPIVSNAESQATLRIKQPDNSYVFQQVTVAAGNITPALGNVSPIPGFPNTIGSTWRNTDVFGLDGQRFIPVTPGSGVVGISIPPLTVKIPQMSGSGQIGAGRMSDAQFPGLFPVSYRYDVAVAASYAGNLLIDLPFDRITDLPPSKLNYAEAFHYNGTTWEKCSSSRSAESIECTTPTASPFMLAIKDGIPPVSNAVFLGAEITLPDNTPFISTNTQIAITSQDPVIGDNVATGVRATYYAINRVVTSTSDSGVQQVAGPITLPEGIDQFVFTSEDYVHNLETPTTMTILVDGTAPISSMTIQGSSSATSAIVVGSSGSYVVLSATDPISHNVSAGLAGIFMLIDTDPAGCGLSMTTLPIAIATAPAGSCQNPYYYTPFSLSPGTHTVGFLAADRVSNIEQIHIASITIDSQPPSVSAIAPASGSFVIGRDSPTISWMLADNYDPAPTAHAFLVRVDTGIPITSTTTVAVSSGEFLPFSQLDDGNWRLVLNASDWVLNSTTSYGGLFQVIRGDSKPPRTQLILGPPSVSSDPLSGTPAYISSSTVVSLLAVDDLNQVNDGNGVGVATLTYIVDSASFSIAASSTVFTITQEGLRSLQFYSVDRVGNRESTQTFSIAVDTTPPSLAFALVGSSLTDRLGRVIISTDTRIVLAATDTVSNAVASGLDSLRYSLDGGQEISISTSSTSLTLPEGPHTVSFYALDRVHNRSITFSTAVIVDASPPTFGTLSARSPGGSYQPASVPLSTTAAETSITVTDLFAGLDVTGSAGGPQALSAIPGTLGLWHFDEISGSIALNAGGPAGNGTLNFDTDRIPGVIGGAVRVRPTSGASRPDGGVTLLPAAYSVINSLPSGTVEFWARIPDPYITTSYHTFTVKQFDGSDTEFWFSVSPGPDQNLWHPANNQAQCYSPFTPNPLVWYHFAATWDGSSQKIYVDGQLKQNCPASAPVPNNPNPTCLSIAGPCGDARIGSKNEIWMDEVRVMNRALSAGEIAADATNSARTFSARLSSDGGVTFVALATAALTGSDGSTTPQTLTAGGMTLKASTSPTDTTNLVEFSARDLAGHVATTKRILLVNLNPTVAPLLASPADALELSTSAVTFSWSLDPKVPAASITGYELDLAANVDFNNPSTIQTTTNTFTTSLTDGSYWWRVRAKDSFGGTSPSSLSSHFTVDTLPPTISAAEVSTAPGAAFRAASLPINSLLVDAHASVRDLASGLRISLVPGGPQALSAIPGTLGLWHFDEPSGSVAVSAGGTAGNGTLNFDTDRIPGVIGGAVRVKPTDGASRPDGGVTLLPPAYSVINNLPSGSVELWARLPDPYITTSYHTFTVKQFDGSDTEFWFSVSPGPDQNLWHPANNQAQCYSPFTPDPLHWYHFAATWDGSTQKIYVDGQLKQNCPGSAPVPNRTNPTCLSIAGPCGDSRIGSRNQIWIDEMRVMNRALSAAEVAGDAASLPALASFFTRLSTDGGLTFRSVDPASVTLSGVDATTSTETMSARGLALVESASLANRLNIVEFNATDLAGHATSFAFSILADTTPPVVAVSSPAQGAIFLAGHDILVPHVSAVDRLDPAPTLSTLLIETTSFGVLHGTYAAQAVVSTGQPVNLAGLDDGVWQLVATAVDFAGNVSTAASGLFTIRHDALPPRTVLLVGTPQVRKDALFVSNLTPLSLSATDDLLVVNDNAGVGVATISYSIDSISTSAYVTYSSTPFNLVQEGRRDLRYVSVDLVGNAESVQLTSVTVDASPPLTSLVSDSSWTVVGGTFYVRGFGPLHLSAFDRPAGLGLSVGLATTYLRVDGGGDAVAAATITLSEGFRRLAFASVDSLGTFESTNTYTVKLDSTSPAAVTSLVALALTTDSVRLTWTAPGDDGFTDDIASGEVRLAFGTDPAVFSSGTAQVVALGQSILVGGAFLQLKGGLTPGTSYYAAVFTRDTAGNWSAESAVASARTFAPAVSSDGVALFLSPAPNATVTTVSSTTVPVPYGVAIGSQALNPVGGLFYELPSGLTFDPAAPASISFFFDTTTVDASSLNIYTYSNAWSTVSIINQTITYLASGAEITGYILHTSLYAAMVRDTVPPLTAFSLSGTGATLEGRLFSDGTSSGVLTAQDLAPRGGVASGLAQGRYSLDGGAETVYLTPFGLPEGVRLVGYRSLDKSGNLELLRTATVFVDATPPVILAAADQSTFPVLGGFGTPASSPTLTLTASDPSVGGAQAGLAAASYILDGSSHVFTLVSGATQTAAAVFLATGTHQLVVNAADRVGHGTQLTLTVLVGDTVPPVTTLSLLGSSTTLEGRLFAAGGSSGILTTQDYAQPGGVPSGVDRTLYAIDGASQTVYFAPFLLPEGRRIVSYTGVDKAGNVELLQSATVYIDGTAPLLAAQVDQSTLPWPGGFETPVATATLIMSFQDPDVSGARAGLARASFTLDGQTTNVAFTVGAGSASQSLILAAGIHHLTQEAADRLGNAAQRSLTIAVGAVLPPVTVFSLAGSSGIFEGRLFGAEGSSAVFTAQGTAPPGGVAVGIAQTIYSQDGSAPTTYSGPFVLQGGMHHLVFHSVDANGNIESDETADVFIDTVAPSLAFAADVATFPVAGGFGTNAATFTLTLSAIDPVVLNAAAGLAAASYVLDGATTTIAFPAGVLQTQTTAALTLGSHRLVFRATDRLGHGSESSLTVAVGNFVAPVTVVSISAPQARLFDGSILVSPRTLITLSADAPNTYYRITPTGQTPGAYTSYGGAFVISAPDGAKLVEFYSIGQAGTVETVKSTAVVLDAAAPSVAFTFPRPDEGGLCRLAQGAVQVRGSVNDLHLSSWSLNSGALLVGSGTANAAGTLGVFNAAGLSGPVSLALNAQDLVLNAASASLQFQTGQPARDLALGGHTVLDKPRGVAAASNRLYVSDTNNDLVRVFDAAGHLLTSFGDKKSALKLNKPAGLAVDGAGNIFVADANNKRVLKLSPSGVQLVQYDGKGVLKKPVAVALSGGNVVVADSQASQLVVFTPNGAFLSRVTLPPATLPADSDDDPEEPRPVALSADAAGNIWVADAKGGRVLRYDSSFTLQQTIPGFQKPEGVAVSPSGACVAVSDNKAERLITFDAAQAAQLAAFGVHGDINPNKPLPSALYLNKPEQIAFAPDGTLLVADRNNDLIQGFGLAGTPAVVAMGSSNSGSGGGARLSAVGDAVPAAAVVQRVGGVEGGRVEHPNGTVVEVPAGALAQDQDISVAAAPQDGADAQARKAAMVAPGLAEASAPRQFGPEGLTFSRPASITLPYEPALLASAGIIARELKVQYWNPQRAAWEPLASVIDESAHTVTAAVAHFSLYQLLAPARFVGTSAVDPEASFSFREVFAFPNPAVDGQKPTIHLAVGKADKVTFRIYDLTGQLIREATVDGPPSVIDSGSGPQFAYEYTWDGHIPSGIYFYSVTAEKAGGAPIKRVGKLAVVR